MNPPRSQKPHRSARLVLQPLEDRCTPASASYVAATQTLTITGSNNDQINVASIFGEPDDYLKVENGAVDLFDSTIGDRAVRNLIVKFGGVDVGAVSVANIHLSGNLTVFGAKVSQYFGTLAHVDGNLTYTATGSAQDIVSLVDGFFAGTSRVYGNATVKLGAGANYLGVAGRVDGNLSVTAGKDADHVSFNGHFSTPKIGGFATIRLGDGENKLGVSTDNPVEIAKSFKYVGGLGRDFIDMVVDSGGFQVGGDATFVLGKAPPTSSNLMMLADVVVGGDLVLTGDSSADTVKNYKNLTVFGDFTVNLGGGLNYLNFSQFGGASNSIAGSLSYQGGAGTDQIYVDGTAVGGNVRFTMGGSPDDQQFLRVGHGDTDGVEVHGAMTVTSGASDDLISLRRLRVSTNLTLKTGDGADTVRMDDTNIAGTTLIELAAGADLLEIEWIENDGLGLDDPTTFGGTFTIRAGTGDDYVDLSRDSKSLTYIQFGGTVSLVGGTGSDKLRDSTVNQFAVSGNFEDFEDGVFV